MDLGSSAPDRLGRYWRTVRHLKGIQAWDRVKPLGSPGQTAKGPRPVAAKASGDFRGHDRRGDEHFGFGPLRGAAHLGARPLDWEPREVPRLWRYHLHYFDEWAIGSGDSALLADWIEANPPGKGTGWEPYPLSRRIPNWIKGFVRRGLADEAFDASLAEQAGFLARTIEYHLLGNHLLANLRGLVFAGAYFSGREADRWLARGVAEYSGQLREQVGADGQHEERSPMYHAIVLSDLLDLIELASVFPGRISARSLSEWKRTAGRMVAWLSGVLHPDGRIAFFQDAAFDMAPEADWIVSRCARLGVRSSEPAGLAKSGFVRLAEGGAVLLADVGEPGPPHQPGHSHAASLAFEFSVGRQRFLVNTGTSTYEPGSRRRYERSTEAHNTIRVGGADQSEMWAAFRVGKRARVLESGHEARAAWARLRFQNGAIVNRRFEAGDGRFVVYDSVESRGEQPVECFFHVHPDIELERAGPASFCLASRDGARVRLMLDPQLECQVEPFDWSPQFGKNLPGVRVAARTRKATPLMLRHRIEVQ